MTREERDEKEFEEFFEKEAYILQFQLVPKKFAVYETVKGWMKESFLASRRLLREEQAEDRRYAQI